VNTSLYDTNGTGTAVEDDTVSFDFTNRHVSSASITFTKVSAGNRTKKLARSRYGLFLVSKAEDSWYTEDGTLSSEANAAMTRVYDAAYISSLSANSLLRQLVEGTATNVEPIQSGWTDDNGQITFTGLRPGYIYVIRELEAPNGYQVSKTGIVVTADLAENGSTARALVSGNGSGTLEGSSSGGYSWV